MSDLVEQAMKKGQLIKAWSTNGDYHTFGFFQGKTIEGKFKVAKYSDGIENMACRHAKPVYLMPELPEGVNIGDECKFSDTTTRWMRGKLAAVTSDGRFVTEFENVYTHCKPIKKMIIKVKRLSALAAQLENGGWEADPDGNFWKQDKPAFLAEMFKFCGQPLTKEMSQYYHFEPEWLEEVEEEA